MTRKKANAEVDHCAVCHVALAPEIKVPGFKICILCNVILGLLFPWRTA